MGWTSLKTWTERHTWAMECTILIFLVSMNCKKLRDSSQKWEVSQNVSGKEGGIEALQKGRDECTGREIPSPRMGDYKNRQCGSVAKAEGKIRCLKEIREALKTYNQGTRIESGHVGEDNKEASRNSRGRVAGYSQEMEYGSEGPQHF
eukprot:c19173_g1_i1 orf=864-1307(-)